MSDTLKMGLNVTAPASTLDPQYVVSTVDAHLSRSLYSNLLSLDDNGRAVGEIASDFKWDGTSLIFELRKYKTIDGYDIGVEDVFYSLLRFIRNDRATHGSLRDFLCADFDKTSGQCSGLQIVDGKLVLTPTHPAKRDFLLLLLTSVDLVIIPKRALNLQSENWDVVDFRNTTGLYYLSHEGEKGAATWSINPNHFRFDAANFPHVEVIPTISGAECVEAFLSKRIDLIPTSANSRKSDIARFGSDITIHATHPVQLLSAAFTRKGHQLAATDRFVIGAHIEAAVEKRRNFANGENTDQIFPPKSDGWLDPKILGPYLARLKSALNERPSQPVTIGVGASLFDDLEDALSELDWLTVERVTRLPYSLPVEQQPEVTILPGDTSYFESLTMIGYYFSLGAFGHETDRKKWLEDYMMLADKDKRLSRLRELHLSLLENAIVFPLYLASYHAVARSNVRLELPTYFPGTNLWRVFRKHF